MVYEGRFPGDYSSWEEAKGSVVHFKGAQYKGYPTRTEAERYYNAYLAFPDNYTAAHPYPDESEVHSAEAALAQVELAEARFDLETLREGHAGYVQKSDAAHCRSPPV